MHFEEPEIFPDSKTGVYTKPCTQLFIASLFITARLGSNQNVLQEINR